MSQSTTYHAKAASGADEELKSTCMHCGTKVGSDRRGWAATCEECEELGWLVGLPAETVAEIRGEREPDRSDAIDAAHLDDMAAIEAVMNEPDPSTLMDLDEIYGERLAEEWPMAFVGHPAQED